MSALIGGIYKGRNNNYFGRYRIAGIVDKLGAPGQYLVGLYSKFTLENIAFTFSDAAGSYQFNWLKYIPNGYFAIAFDHGDNPLNAAIADLITPELMP